MIKVCPFSSYEREQIVNCLCCQYCLSPFERSNGICGFVSSSVRFNNLDNSY